VARDTKTNLGENASGESVTDGNAALPGHGALEQAAESALQFTRDFVKALLGEEQFVKHVQDVLMNHQRPQSYLLIDTGMAKALYAVLKLQHQFLRGPAEQLAEIQDFPEANRENIAKFAGLRSDSLRTILIRLMSARDILPGGLRRSKELHETSSGKGLEIFEPRVDLVVSCADTAIVLLNLLEQARENLRRGPHAQFGDRDPDREMDGKVERRPFVEKLIKSRKLAYFSSEDLLGDERQKGKLDELADAGEYIERVSATFIRPRMRIALERKYLKLVSQQVALERLAGYKWSDDSSEWSDRN